MNKVVKFENQATKLEELKTLGQVLVKTGKYKNWTVEDFINVGMIADELHISRMKCYNGGLYPVNGKISMSTGLMTEMIRARGHSIKVIEMTEEKCVIIGQRRDNGDSCKCEYNTKDAERAGLLESVTWKKHPKAMRFNRCMSMLARVLFSDVIGGNTYDQDEALDIQGIPAEKRIEEEPDTLTVNIETGEIIQEAPLDKEECITTDQLNELTDMTYGQPELIVKILEKYEVRHIKDLKECDYETIKKRVRKTLEQQTQKESVG